MCGGGGERSSPVVVIVLNELRNLRKHICLCIIIYLQIIILSKYPDSAPTQLSSYQNATRRRRVLQRWIPRKRALKQSLDDLRENANRFSLSTLVLAAYLLSKPLSDSTIVANTGKRKRPTTDDEAEGDEGTEGEREEEYAAPKPKVIKKPAKKARLVFVWRPCSLTIT